MTERKMATIRRIDSIGPIEGADAIEVATVGGWKVVVKKGEFTPGQLAVYLEIDSWVPSSIGSFLTKPGHFPKIYEGVEGEKLRTIKLRGQLSQGLLLPMSVMTDNGVIAQVLKEDEDVSQALGILKYEAPISAQLAGLDRGNFPSGIPKTDQERIQNLSKELQTWIDYEFSWEVTEKLDGSSCTMYLDRDGEFHVCSRNLDLKRDENNSFWKMAIDSNVEEMMKSYDLFGCAIQGELIGEGIQGNPYKIKGQQFFVFDLYVSRLGEYMSPADCLMYCQFLVLKHVPIISPNMILSNLETVDGLLKFAEGFSVLNGTTPREGVVFKHNRPGGKSFKAISNAFLMKQKD